MERPPLRRLTRQFRTLRQKSATLPRVGLFPFGRPPPRPTRVSVPRAAVAALWHSYLTVISSSHLVVGREESFCRFMCHDLAPSPWAAENTLPLP